MFAPGWPAVRGDLLVGGHVGHVIDFTLLGLVHGLVGLLVPPAQTEAPPEASWSFGTTKGGATAEADRIDMRQSTHE